MRLNMTWTWSQVPKQDLVSGTSTGLGLMCLNRTWSHVPKTGLCLMCLKQDLTLNWCLKLRIATLTDFGS